MAANGNSLTQSRRDAEVAEKVRLGEVCLKDVFTIKARIGWQGLTRKEHLASGDYYLITGTDFVDGIVDFEHCKYVAKERFDQDPNIQIRPNDLLITKDGTIGKVALVGSMDKPATLNSGVFVLRRRNDEFALKYLYYFFYGPKFRKLVDGNLTGCTIAHLNQANLLDFTIQVRTLPEQKRIAGELDKICELKKNAETRLEKLDLLVKSRFVEMFGDLVINDRGWKFSPLGKVCDVRDGTHASPKYQMHGYPLMTSKNFTDGYEDFSDVKLISKEDYDEINKRSRVDLGDIVMPMIGTIGNPVIIKTDREFAIKNVSLIKFTNDSPNNVFVKAVLSSHYFQRVIEERNRGNTQKFIALGDIRGFLFPLPPLALQREFAAFVEKVDKLKDIAKKSVEHMDTLYRAKLQEYFG